MSDFIRGIKESFGLAMTVAIFGGLYAAAAAEKNLSIWETMIMTAGTFAGSAQFTTLYVWGDLIPLWTVVISAALIASRNILMGMVIGHEYIKHPAYKYVPAVFIFGDLNYVMGLQADHIENKFAYMTGIGAVVYGFWLAGTLAGALLAEYFNKDIIEALAYAGIMFMGMLIILLLKSNKSNKSPLVVASLMTLVMMYLGFGQAAIMIGAVVSGGIANLILEFGFGINAREKQNVG